MLRLFKPQETTAQSYVLSFDIETSGCSYKENGIVSIGATVLDNESNEVDHFLVNVQLPEGKIYEKRCWEEFWSKHPEACARVQKDALPPVEAMQKFVAFVNKAEKSSAILGE
jgi:DNA polymerase III alpha subunit (gram-positive type)